MNRTTEGVGAGIIIILLIGFLGFSGNAFIQSSNNIKPTTTTITPAPTGIEPQITSNAEIQMRTFTPPAQVPVPTSGGACNHDNGQPAQVNDGQPVDPNDLTCTCAQFLVQCQNKVCIKLYKSSAIPNPPAEGCSIGPGGPGLQSTFDSWCSAPYLAPKDGTYCLGKPVIYLYPEKTMQVSVKLDIPGVVTQSIPTYPVTGWQNITANPGGIFQYEGKSYNELYYESSVSGNIDPQNGVVLSTSDLSSGLSSLVTKMGLIPHERDEFLAYWLPRLEALDKPYVFVSFFTPEEKEAVDKVIVSPKPDTTIAFLVYFKGLATNETVPSLQFPSVPKRNGFTMVEWGGTIAH